MLGATSEVPGHTNDFYINDGSLPFGLDTNEHDEHETGKQLDIRTFDVRQENYDKVDKIKGKLNPSQLFLPNSRYEDIAILIYVARAAAALEIKLNTKFIRESDCGIRSLNPDAIDICSIRPTVEYCMFLVVNPEAGSDCELLHTHIAGGLYSKDRIRDANYRLSFWINRNREVLENLVSNLEIASNSSFMYSNGDHSTSKIAITTLVNRGPMALAHMEKSSSLEDAWNFKILETTDVPKTISNSGVLVPTITLLNIDHSKVRPFSVRALKILKPETKFGHFDHFHMEWK